MEFGLKQSTLDRFHSGRVPFGEFCCPPVHIARGRAERGDRCIGADVAVTPCGWDGYRMRGVADRGRRVEAGEGVVIDRIAVVSYC